MQLCTTVFFFLTLLLAHESAAQTCSCVRNPNMFQRPGIVTPDLLNLINFYFPSGGPVRNPALITDASDPNIHFLAEGYITVTFAFEGAGFRNQFGYFTYELDSNGNPVNVQTTILFPDVSQDGGCLVAGDSMKIGPFQAGQRVGFYIVADGNCSPRWNIFTVDQLNSNGQRQFGVFRDPATNLIVLAIEDILLPDGDRDFEDVVFVIEVEGNFDDSGIIDVCLPECPEGYKCVKLRDGTLACQEEEPAFVCGDGSTRQKPFGDVASLFNVFVFEKFNCKFSDTEGRLAAGGDIDIESYSVGCRVFTPELNCINFGDLTCAQLNDAELWADTVVSGKNVFWTHGEVKAGNLVYGSSSSLNNVNIVSDCEARHDTVIDFAFQKNFLQGVSNNVRGAATTGTVTDEFGSLRFTGTNANVEVFSVTGDKLSNAHGITFSGIKNGATVLINVSGKNVAVGNFGFFDAKPELTLWNFWEATSLTFQSIQWEGSVLAVNADIVEPTGQINGQVFAKSWRGSQTGTCMQQNHAPFEGCVPTDEPGEFPPPPPPICIPEDCAENPLGAAKYYNGFFKEDFVCDNSDVEGRLAVGGNAAMNNMGIGNCILVDHDSTDKCVNYQSCLPLGDQRQGLVVEGNTAGSNIGVDAGDVVHGGTLNGVFVNGQGCQKIQQGSFVNFGSEFAKLEELCTNLNTLAATGSYEILHGSLIFTGKGDVDREVFNLEGSVLNSIHTIRMNNVKSKATIIINVSGSTIVGNPNGFGFNENVDWAKITRHVLWNFCDSVNMTFKNVGWRGTILAPKADLKGLTGQIDGQVIARKWSGGGVPACMELHEHPFAGCLPQCY